MDKLYGSRQVIVLARVTHRQLQWWDERKIVVPEQHNHKRVYTPQQVLVIMAIKAMKGKGVTPDHVRAALPTIERELKTADMRNALLVLGTQGHTRIHKNTTTAIYEMADELDQPCWVFDLGQMWNVILDDSSIGVDA